MKTSKEYWVDRNLQNIEYAKSVEKDFMKLEKAEYKRIIKDINHKIENLYLDMLEHDGEISNTNLYAYNRYQKLREQIFTQFSDLANTENQNMYDALKDVYEHTFCNTDIQSGKLQIAFTRLDREQMRDALKSVSYGEDFSSRIWSNNDECAKLINKAVRDTISGAGTVAEAKKAVLKQFDKGYYNTNRLVRTETMHTLNKSTANRYQNLGIKKYQFYATEDERTCDICGKMHEKIYDFCDMVIGTNAPPMHPMCRCTILPVIEQKELTNNDNKSNIYKEILVQLPDGSMSRLTDGTKITDIEVFAGKGSNTDLRVKDFLVKNYGGKADNWQHSKGRGYVDSPKGSKNAVLHWFEEETIGIKELRVKAWSTKQK